MTKSQPDVLINYVLIKKECRGRARITPRVRDGVRIVWFVVLLVSCNYVFLSTFLEEIFFPKFAFLCPAMLGALKMCLGKNIFV